MSTAPSIRPDVAAAKQPTHAASRPRGVGARLLAASAIALLLAGNVALARAGYRLFSDVQRVRSDPYGLSVYGGAPAPADVAGTRRVLLYGDSRAQMWSTPARVGSFAFVNRGIGSQSTAQILGRFEQDLAALHPDVVVLELGINDLKTIALFPDEERAIVARVKQNIATLVRRARDVGATVVLVTVFPVGPVAWSWLPVWTARVPASVVEVNAYLESLRAPGVRLLHANEVLLDAKGEIDPRFALDMLHLTPAAYAALNDRQLLPLLATLE
ncbi:MAG: GDSL-type esterase/lipase family protein [Polyangiales bacterium]